MIEVLEWIPKMGMKKISHKEKNIHNVDFNISVAMFILYLGKIVTD